ncbi:MAG: biotin/lipoyl-containing protein [Anaerolineae bacterium]
MPTYNVTIGDKTYNVKVPNPNERPVRAIVDGVTLEVKVAQERVVQVAPATPPVASSPAPVAKAEGPSTRTEVKDGTVLAPLPGTVVAISVKVGQKVEMGEELLVLEAMKMKNPIRAKQGGTVVQIHVHVGDQVQHGAPLLTLKV